jgi:hypothetical protein
MARIEWIEHRLLNWARWKMQRGGGVGGLGYASVNLIGALSGGGRQHCAETVVPTNEIEAAATDAAISRLHPGGLALAVREHYTGRGGIKDQARRLCCAESTLHARIAQAHRQLADHFLAQQDKAKAERARVEALQAKARPGSFTP